jgi:LPS sulfotransferase NodH
MEFTYLQSNHDAAIEELFVDSAGVPPRDQTFPCVVLGFVNRSGSNYLAELLKSTGRFAGFGECLNAYNVRYLAPRYGVSTFNDYLMRLRKEDLKNSYQTWGIKAGWMQIAMLYRTGAIPNLLRPMLIQVRRRDVISQAVSYFIAEQTAQWTSADKPAIPREKIEYDGQRILNLLRAIVDSYAKLEEIAVVSGCPYHQIFYEDLIDNPYSTITEITRFLIGRALAPVLPAVRLSIQRDQLNEEFRFRFLAELDQLKWKFYS